MDFQKYIKNLVSLRHLFSVKDVFCLIFPLDCTAFVLKRVIYNISKKFKAANIQIMMKIF